MNTRRIYVCCEQDLVAGWYFFLTVFRQRVICGLRGLVVLVTAPFSRFLFQERDLLSHPLVHLVKFGDRDREVDEDEQDEEHADKEKKRGRVVDPRRIRNPYQPIPLQRENEHDHCARQPEDGILLPQLPPPDHFQDIEEQDRGGENGDDGNPVQSNLRIRLMRNESVTFTI